MAMHSSRKVIYAALLGNTLIALSKFIAAWFTGSAAMFSEAIHSSVDTGNEMLLLHGESRAARPPDPDHPFGHGLQLYFWAFVVAVLIFGVGAGLSVLHGVEQVRRPEPIENVYVSYLVLGLAMLFEGYSWTVAVGEFRRTKGDLGFLAAIKRSKDPVVFTVLLEDSAALLGLVVAMMGVTLSQVLDMPRLDGVASIIIGVILAGTALFLAREAQSLLTGEAVDPAVRADIRRIAAEQQGVCAINEMLTMHFGPREVLVTLSLEFTDQQTSSAVEDAVSAIERRVRTAHPEVMRVFVEVQSRAAHQRAARARLDRAAGPGASGQCDAATTASAPTPMRPP